MNTSTRKGPVRFSRTGPHHAQEQDAAKRTARQHNTAGDSAEQLNRNPVEIVEAALAAMLDAWPNITEDERARILAGLGARRLAASGTISLKSAAHRAGRSPQRVAALCAQHGLGGKILGRWHVDAARLDAFIAGGRS